MKSVTATAVFLALLTVGSAASAQTRGYVLGTAGHGSLWDDEGSLGKGAVFGAAVGWNILDNISIEGAFTDTHHKRSGTLGWEGHPRALTGRVMYRFQDPGSRVRIFVAGGLGYFRYPGTFTDLEFPNPREPGIMRSRDWLVTGLQREVGTGLDVNVGSRLVIRPEFWVGFARGERNSPAPEPSYMTPHFAVSAGVRF